jgi:hypothetical protein
VASAASSRSATCWSPTPRATDGTTALDGNGRNSPFTAALLRNIETPRIEVNVVRHFSHGPCSYRPKVCWIASAFSRAALLARPVKIGSATINSKHMTKRVWLTRRFGRLRECTFELSGFSSFSIASARVSLESSPNVILGNSLHQFADFRFQVLIRHDQSLERPACRHHTPQSLGPLQPQAGQRLPVDWTWRFAT